MKIPFFIHRTWRVMNLLNLKIYLNDHLGASVAGIQMAKHCLKNSDDFYLSKFLSEFLTQITEEQSLLKKILIHLNENQSPLKRMTGWLAEKIAHLKLNYRSSHAELSRLLELEGLLAGVHAKLDMWKMVERFFTTTSEFPNSLFRSLIERVEKQITLLEKFCLQIGEKAFHFPNSNS